MDIGRTYNSICQRYVSHVRKYGKPVIVFDGYQSGPTPKDGTQASRTAFKLTLSVHFNESMPLQMKKDEF